MHARRSTPSTPRCAATRPTTCRACRASARRRRPSSSPRTAASTASSPTSTSRRRSCAQNLAEHEAQVRQNAEVMVLLRDVALDVDLDDLRPATSTPRRCAPLRLPRVPHALRPPGRGAGGPPERVGAEAAREVLEPRGGPTRRPPAARRRPLLDRAGGPPRRRAPRPRRGLAERARALALTGLAIVLDPDDVDVAWLGAELLDVPDVDRRPGAGPWPPTRCGRCHTALSCAAWQPAMPLPLAASSSVTVLLTVGVAGCQAAQQRLRPGSARTGWAATAQRQGGGDVGHVRRLRAQPGHVHVVGVEHDGQAGEGRAPRGRPARPRRGRGARRRGGPPTHRRLRRRRPATPGGPPRPCSTSRAASALPLWRATSTSASRSNSVRNSRKSKRRRSSSTSRSPHARSARARTSRATSRTSTITLGVPADLGLVLGEVLPQLRRLLVEVGEDAVEAAVGGDELGGRLLPHPRDAGQVVGGVAAQRGVLGVLGRRHAGALQDPRLVVEGVVATRRACCRGP